MVEESKGYRFVRDILATMLLLGAFASFVSFKNNGHGNDHASQQAPNMFLENAEEPDESDNYSSHRPD